MHAHMSYLQMAPPHVDTKSKKQKEAYNTGNYRSNAPNQGPWGWGTIYIYILLHREKNREREREKQRERERESDMHNISYVP